jgi:hypothetical protein
MAEQKQEQEGGRSRIAHRCAVCGRVFAVLSLVVVGKRLRDRRHTREQEKARHRFPTFGH